MSERRMADKCRGRIRSAFDGAADSYDSEARLQRLLARRLGALVSKLPLRENPRMLELGCGTGLLTRELLRRNPSASLLATDLAPGMVGACRKRVGGLAETAQGCVQFAVMDGEALSIDGRFDLIAAGMVAQWFSRPVDGLRAAARALEPEGYLVFSLLGAGTFREWADLVRQAGGEPRVRQFPTRADFVVPDWGKAWCRVSAETHVVNYRSPAEFLRSLRRIGAGTGRENIPPLDRHRARQVLERGRAQVPFQQSYEVIVGLIGGEGAPAPDCGILSELGRKPAAWRGGQARS